MVVTETEEWIKKTWCVCMGMYIYIYIYTYTYTYIFSAISHSSVGKPACNAGDPGSIPGLGRSPGEGNGNPSPVFSLESSTDREAWQVTVHGVSRIGHSF